MSLGESQPASTTDRQFERDKERERKQMRRGGGGGGMLALFITYISVVLYSRNISCTCEDNNTIPYLRLSREDTSLEHRPISLVFHVFL